MPIPPNPLKHTPTHRLLRRYPLLFGLPFLAIIVGASFGMATFTQTRYDLQNQRVKQMSREEELGLKKDRRTFDVREEYYRLEAAVDNDWEPKRIARPKGVPEWGVPPSDSSSR